MDGIRCIYCESSNVTFDSVSETYFCKECNRILGEEEVEKIEEHHVTRAEKSDGGELSDLALMMVNILLCIPLINLVVVGTVVRSNLMDSYKRMISFKLIVDICAILLLSCIFGIYIISAKDSISNEINSKVKSVILALNGTRFTDDDFPELETKDLWEIIESRKPAVTDTNEEIDEEEFVFDWSYISDMYVTGGKAEELLNAVGDNIIILVQTDEIRNRYTSTTFRNVGLMVVGADMLGTTDNYFYDGSLSGSMDVYIDDYNKKVYMDPKDIYNKKYIYYLNPSKMYQIKVLYDSNQEMSGLAFIEEKPEVVEDNKEVKKKR